MYTMKITKDKICDEKSKTFNVACSYFSKSVFFYDAIFLERKRFLKITIVILSAKYTHRKRTLFIRAFIFLSHLYCYASANSKWLKRERSIFDKLPRLAASIIPREYRS